MKKANETMKWPVNQNLRPQKRFDLTLPVYSTKHKVSVSRSISQGKDFFIDFLESFLIDDSVGTLLLKGSVEGTYFSCNELKWGSTVEQIQNLWPAQCLKITEKVSFNIASEASYIYSLSGQKFITDATNSQFWRVIFKQFDNILLFITLS